MHTQPNSSEEWTSIIEPRKRFFQLNLRDLWEYRDLYTIYVRRNVVTQYKQTILGLAWFFISPIFTTVMYMFVFGGLAGIGTDGIPQAVFYLSGILLWNYFNACLNSNSQVLAGNASLFSKVYFPRLIVPLAGMTSSLITFGIQLMLLIIVYIYYLLTGAPLAPQWSLLLLPVYLFLIAMTAMSWGLIVSSLTVKYRDLNMLIGFGISLLMYATPIIYPMSIASQKSYGWLLRLNPLSSIFESFRYSLTGVGSMDWMGLLYTVGCLCVTMFLGLVVFSRAERNFIDTV
ncbi:MAG: ABC transporter permease [Bacteroidales bacterium]|nr:ABC transporter permease [Bacteroidales bacterium]